MMTGIRHTEALLLVWRLAELEAKNLQAAAIAPQHLFLGLLKCVDVDLMKLTAILGGEEKAAVNRKLIADVRAAFDYIAIKTTPVRRGLRKTLANEIEVVVEEKKRLRRTPETKAIFLSAEETARKGTGEVTPVHLLLALAEMKEPTLGRVLTKSKITPEAVADFLGWL